MSKIPFLMAFYVFVACFASLSFGFIVGKNVGFTEGLVRGERSGQLDVVLDTGYDYLMCDKSNREYCNSKYDTYQVLSKKYNPDI